MIVIVVEFVDTKHSPPRLCRSRSRQRESRLRLGRHFFRASSREKPSEASTQTDEGDPKSPYAKLHWTGEGLGRTFRIGATAQGARLVLVQYKDDHVPEERSHIVALEGPALPLGVEGDGKSPGSGLQDDRAGSPTQSYQFGLTWALVF